MENIDELTIMNDVIFGVVMRQEKYCKPLLEFILGIKIKKIVYENDQETISAPVIKAKSIALMFTLRMMLGRFMTLKFKLRINTMWAREPAIIRA